MTEGRYTAPKPPEQRREVYARRQGAALNPRIVYVDRTRKALTLRIGGGEDGTWIRASARLSWQAARNLAAALLEAADEAECWDEEDES